MSNISLWIISIAGVCILSVLIDLILPEGKTTKYIKSMFGYVIILVMISPLPKLINMNVDFNNTSIMNELNIQEDYIYQLNKYKIEMLVNSIESELVQKDIIGVEIGISANIFTTELKIDTIFVDLFDLVINENLQHIDIKKTIIETILDKIDIGEDKIIFND